MFQTSGENNRKSHPFSGAFLQSAEWEQLQKAIGRPVWRIEGVLLMRHDMPYGYNYLYCPRPSFADEKSARVFFENARDIATRERSIFLKVDPVEDFSLQGFSLHPSSSLQPQYTRILSLMSPEDQLLRLMHEKTRYNIRLAERRGVVVVKATHAQKEADIDIFWDLLKKTATRDKFYPHERKYYVALYNTRSENYSCELFFATFQNKVIAAALVNFYTTEESRVATYLHGASLGEHKEVMAPHLLHWRIIQDARNRNFNYYDFWGIDEKKWPGVSRFKSGFGGDVVQYPHSFDIVFRPAYYFLYRTIRKIF